MLQVVVSAARYVGPPVSRRARKVVKLTFFTVSQYFIANVFSRLVELSVCKKARLDSDSTLVAVITAVGASLE